MYKIMSIHELSMTKESMYMYTPKLNC